MKRIRPTLVIAVTVVVSAALLMPTSLDASSAKTESVRMREHIDFGWKFFKGDANGAQRPDYDDSNWRSLDLPHDWSIEGPFAEDNPTGRKGGYLPAGIGWYRKHMLIRNELKGKCILIEFDGAYMNSEVWINGQHVGERPNGYMGFRYDVTKHVKFGKDNVIAVRLDNSKQPNSRWYSGSGIYRHVWLTATNPIHVAHWGTYVTTPEITEELAKVVLSTTVSNGSKENSAIEVLTKVLDENGRVLYEVQSSKEIAAGAEIEFKQNATVKKPSLWSPETPYMYSALTEIRKANELIDTYATPFGIRSFRFDADKGFFLNGQNVKLKGMCMHHGAGSVGAAVPDKVIERRLKMLKDMGCNAIRTAHNPFSPVFLDMCDEMGFMVLDEIFDEWDQAKVDYGYHLYFEEWWEQDLRDQILRDRNHPSVIMWSIGNEIHGKGEESTVEILRKMRDAIHLLEPTRPVTAGSNTMKTANKSGFAQALDVVGYNGGGGSCFEYDADHKTYPDRKMYGSEVPHSFQTRGVYRTQTTFRDPSKMKRMVVPHLTKEEVFTEFSPYYNSSYDNSYVRVNARDSWRLTSERDFMAGEFRWTAFDYLGESRGWPGKNFNAGIIDTCGFPKENFYFYKSRWTDKPMVHILPHWTWPGKEDVVIPVWAYTNCDSVELFHNGKSLGEQEMGGKFNLSWNVAYLPGKLKALGKRNGKVVCRDEVNTAGAPAVISATSDRKKIIADGQDLFHLEARILDNNGVFVPNADNLITFEIEGPGRIIGVDNGDPISHESYKTNYRKAFSGMCLAIVQAGRTPGTIKVKAVSDGLKSATVSVRTSSAK